MQAIKHKSVRSRWARNWTVRRVNTNSSAMDQSQTFFIRFAECTVLRAEPDAGPHAPARRRSRRTNFVGRIDVVQPAPPLFLRPCKVLSSIANTAILKVAHHTLRISLQHDHVRIHRYLRRRHSSSATHTSFSPTPSPPTLSVLSKLIFCALTASNSPRSLAASSRAVPASLRASSR